MTSDAPIYHWDRTVGAGVPCQIVRRRYTAGRGWRLHRHDFSEVFWIEAGDGIHRIGGHEHRLVPGAIVFMRPDDAHTCIAGMGMAAVNCSFPTAAVAGLARRLGSRWPWRPGPLPLIAALPPPAMRRLTALVDDLPQARPDDLDRDALLIELTRLLVRPPGGGEAAGLPGWLQSAVEAFTDPGNLPGGTARLAALAGRSPEHLARTVRAAQGRTATDLVNALRLRWAAAALREDDRPVAEIAATCGLPHLTHFYRLFRQAYATTPHGWRQAGWQVQPPMRTS